MDFYKQVIDELSKLYEKHMFDNKHTGYVSNISDVQLKFTYDNTLRQIENEKNTYSNNQGIYTYLGSHKDAKFKSNLLNHLNHFKTTMAPILPMATIKDFEMRQEYERAYVINEKKRKHDELLKTEDAVFIASNKILRELKTKKRFLF